MLGTFTTENSMNSLTQKTLTKRILASSLLATMALVSGAEAANIADTAVKFSGYIKVDAMYTDYSNGEGIGPLRDIYVPSLVQTGATDDNLGGRFDAHAKQSRFRFTTNTPVDGEDVIIGVFELDFLLTSGGDERVANSYTPRMRHAYFKYNNWLVGQTWSTIMDLGALVESVDFIGTTDGVAFTRQPQIRYSNNGFEVALENPETTVGTSETGRITTDDNSVPDLIGTYTMRTSWGHIKVGGILRQLAYETQGENYSDIGLALSLSSRINFSNGDDIRIQAASGSGIGRYVGVNAANGAFLDDEGNFDAVDATAITLAYRHLWTERARTNFIFSALDVDTVSGMVGSRTNDVYSTRINYIYNITKPLSVGLEYTYAKRETVDGFDGDMSRIQAMAKYAF
tara:strand:+ start:8371 stop:9570 length:1200 start_codon:yes stop_codon:yes gene_type:complete